MGSSTAQGAAGCCVSRDSRRDPPSAIPRGMSAAILAIGTELTRGEIHDTNSTWLCERVTALGLEVTECSVVPDDMASIRHTLRRLSLGHTLVICTGGLGPTTDDLTTAAVAAELGVGLVRDADSLLRIETRMRAVGRSVAASNAKQADFPEGATVLANDFGTAPGFSVDLDACRFVFLPGVPREMEGMFEAHVAQLVRARVSRHIHQIRLRTFGAPESQINDALSGIEEEFGVTLGYRAHFPEIEVKCLAYRAAAAEARAAARAAADAARVRLGGWVYGEGDRALPQVVGDLLRAQGYRLAIAESCTGGLAAELVTRQPASDFFQGAVVSYANSVKADVLGVPRELLARFGAVSEPVARAMAEGARRVLGADVGISFTGVAGPGGGTSDKPVGLVHYAVAMSDETRTFAQVFTGDRARIQLRAVYACFDELRKRL